MFNNEWLIEVKIVNRYDKSKYFVIRDELINVEKEYLKKYLFTRVYHMTEKLTNYLNTVLTRLDKDLSDITNNLK